MRISVISYNHVSTIVIENESPRVELMQKIRNGAVVRGGTNFELPMMEAYALAERYKINSSAIVMYFLSDGSADYPV